MTAIIALVNAFLDALPPREHLATLEDCQTYTAPWLSLLAGEFPNADYRDALVEQYAMTLLPGFEQFAREHTATDGRAN